MRILLLATAATIAISAAAAAGEVVKVAPWSCEKDFPNVIPINRTSDEDYTLRPGKNNVTADFRGSIIKGQGSPKSGSVLTVNAYNGVCVRGGAFIGLQDPQVVPWVEGHSTYGAGVLFKGGAGPVVLEGVVIANSLQDGVTISGSLPASTTFGIRGSLIRNNSDDAIQNDGGKKILFIEDSLIESKMGLSIRPGADSDQGSGSAGDYSIPIRNTLWNLICVADDRPDAGLGVDPDRRNPTVAKKNNCGPSRSVSSLFKWSGAASKVKIDMSDSIVRVEGRDRNGWRAMDWIDGTYENVVMVWDPTTAGQKYEGPKLPDGVTMTTDVSVWVKAKLAWLDAHGCPPDASKCNAIIPGKVTVPPVIPPVEPIEPGQPDPNEELMAIKGTIADALATSSPVTPDTTLGRLQDMYLMPKESIDALEEAVE